MEKYVLFIILYFGFILAFFELLQKPLFCLYNRSTNSAKMSLRDVWQVYSHGFVTDCIIASYLTAIPVLSVWAYSHYPFYNFQGWFIFYNAVIALAVSMLVVADVALYKFWQFKIDASIFVYLKSLKGSFASVSALYIVTALVAVLIVTGIFFALLQIPVAIYMDIVPFEAEGWLQHIGTILIALLAIACFFLIIRGLKIRPNNPSVAYYSKNPFYNHAALNPLYNLIYSLSVKDDFEGKFRSFSDEECEAKFKPMFPTSGTPEKLLNTTRPNVVLIVWESLCASFIETLGGQKDVCRNIDRLSKEGVYFTHVDAGSFRTDRGLVCLLSGVLGQPTTSVIRYTRKLPNLPAFPRVLRNEGYETMALHGGDLTIMHKADYYLASGHDTLVSQKDLPSSAPTCKWGIQDGFTFDWLYEDIIKKTKENKQWYTTFQTLSSHEPFDVPYDRLKEDKIANSFAYVDDAFGKFVDKLKQSPAWDNLLIICTGDHGFNAEKPIARSEYPHIPLLMLGGAVKAPKQIDKLISQTDLAATLLGQMELPHEDFVFSRDVMADTYQKEFSFHTYNNGFLYRNAKGFTNYDNVSDTAIEGADAEREEAGKVILQKLYDYLKKK